MVHNVNWMKQQEENSDQDADEHARKRFIIEKQGRLQASEFTNKRQAEVTIKSESANKEEQFAKSTLRKSMVVDTMEENAKQELTPIGLAKMKEEADKSEVRRQSNEQNWKTAEAWRQEQQMKQKLQRQNEQRIKSAPCVFQTGNVPGGDLFAMPLTNILDQYDCCRLCANETKCNYCAYSVSNKHCFLKSSKSGNVVNDVNVFFGTRQLPELGNMEYADYPGNDLFGAQGAADANDCMARCQSFDQCSFFTFYVPGKTCFFKYGRGLSVKRTDVISGTRPSLCTSEVGKVAGNDITMESGLQREDCCRRCSSDTRCIYYQYQFSTKTCWLKSAKSGPVDGDRDYVFGTRLDKLGLWNAGSQEAPFPNLQPPSYLSPACQSKCGGQNGYWWAYPTPSFPSTQGVPDQFTCCARCTANPSCQFWAWNRGSYTCNNYAYKYWEPISGYHYVPDNGWVWGQNSRDPTCAYKT